jgi:hypothetical protein
MFPTLPGQSGYNKRVRAAGPLISAVITALAKDTPSWHEMLRPVDSTPLPIGMSRETVKRSDLAGDAGYGYCASHSRYFWGFRLYLISTTDGMPVLWALANPKIGEREVTQAMLEQDHHLIRPDRKDEKPRFGNFGGIRQWIESVFDTLKGQLRLERHGGRTTAGVYARVGAKLLAMSAAIWHNWRTEAPRKRSFIAYDH